MASVSTVNRPREGDGRDDPRARSPKLADTLVMSPVVTGGGVITTEPAETAVSRFDTAPPREDEPGTSVLDMAAFWPALEAAEADERAHREQHLGNVLVLVPAHNEAASIASTLRSLQTQTKPPAEILVVCDNCTDNTALIAEASGARVMSTVGNTKKKAGALNQALATVLPQMGRDDMIMTMDADSQLCPVWLERAEATMRLSPKIGAVCGVFLGEHGAGLIGQFQRNEFVRYARQVGRHNQAPVLSGTGTLFRVRALREVARERGHRLPDNPGQCYSTISITEDNEITLALKTIGYKCWSVPGCYTLTELMPTWAQLFRQRLRWQRGTLTDLRTYGISLITLGAWLKQIFIYLAITGTIATWAIMCLSIDRGISFNLQWSIAVGSLTLVERLITVRRAGLIGLLLALVLIPEFCYDLFKLSFFLRALFDNMRRVDVHWNHVVKGDV